MIVNDIVLFLREDTSSDQFEFLSLLCGPENVVAVVGDDDQQVCKHAARVFSLMTVGCRYIHGVEYLCVHSTAFVHASPAFVSLR